MGKGRVRSQVSPILFAKRGLYETFHQSVATLGWKRKNEKILIGLSGGRDSVVLAHLLVVSGYQVTAAHLNHQLRGRESRADEKFVRSICKDWNIPLVIKQANVRKLAAKHKLSIEEAARIARYQFLEATAKKLKVTKIVVAHHQRDQAETVLLKIFFGCDRKHLRGMEMDRPMPKLDWTTKNISRRKSHLRLIRPLLRAPYSEIISYAKQNNLPFREDSSNQLIVHPRNWLRNELLPLIEKKLNRNVMRTLARLAET